MIFSKTLAISKRSIGPRTGFALAISSLVILSVAFLASPVDAADAKLNGQVVDKEGKPLAKISVVLKSLDGEVNETATTNKKGKFSMDGLDATKQYRLRLESAEYGPYEGPLEQLQAGKVLEGTWPLLTRQEMEQFRTEMALIETKNKASRLYNEAVKLYRAEERDEAAAMFEKALGENPELSIALAGLATVQLEQEKYTEAISTLGTLIEQKPEEELGYGLLYDAQLGLGQAEESAAILAKLVAEFPSSDTAIRLFNSAVAEVKSQKLREALEHFKAAVEMEPRMVQGHLNMASIHRAFGEWPETLAAVDKYLASNPTHPNGLALRYEAVKEVGTEEEAAVALAVLKKENPEGAARIFYERGVKLFNEDGVAEALASFLNVLAVSPDHGPVHYMLGLCSLNAGALDDAKRYLSRFVELAPDDPEVANAREMLASL